MGYKEEQSGVEYYSVTDEHIPFFERTYSNLKTRVEIEDFQLSETLRNKGLGEIWYKNHIEPYLVKCGFGIVSIRGTCLDYATDTSTEDFWRKQGFDGPYELNHAYKAETIVHHIMLKVLNGSSPIRDKIGGIDFRTLPMNIQPIGSFNGLNFKLPRLSKSELEQINVDSEIQQIKNMLQAGITPSGERIKEIVAACVQKEELNSYADNLLLCLVDILKLEEDNASESSPELKEALAIVDSQT